MMRYRKIQKSIAEREKLVAIYKELIDIHQRTGFVRGGEGEFGVIENLIEHRRILESDKRALRCLETKLG
jgi:hypothetical protein